mgnify:CR=1 FL=1
MSFAEWLAVMYLIELGLYLASRVSEWLTGELNEEAEEVFKKD